jgi:hypothetical protein
MLTAPLAGDALTFRYCLMVRVLFFCLLLGDSVPGSYDDKFENVEVYLWNNARECQSVCENLGMGRGNKHN